MSKPTREEVYDALTILLDNYAFKVNLSYDKYINDYLRFVDVIDRIYAKDQEFGEDIEDNYV